MTMTTAACATAVALLAGTACFAVPAIMLLLAIIAIAPGASIVAGALLRTNVRCRTQLIHINAARLSLPQS